MKWKLLIVANLMLVSVTTFAQLVTTSFDSILALHLSEFKCHDTVHAMFLTGNAAPTFRGSSEKFEGRLNSKLTMPKNVKGKMWVRFLVNCEGDIGFVRLSAHRRYQRLNRFIDSNRTQILEAFAGAADWMPAIIDGAEVDAEHSLELTFKRGALVQIE